MNSDVEKVKEKLSIVDVVGGYVQLQRAGANFRSRCPFHKEKTPSFMVSPERGSYMCFGCGERGDIFSFVQKMEGIDFPTALKQLAERAGVTLERRTASPEHAAEHKQKEERLREVCEAATKFFEAELQKRKDVQEYLRTRGVTEDTRAAWRIGYAPASWHSLYEALGAQNFTKQEIMDAGLIARAQKEGAEERVYDRFRGRVMFPLADTAGHVIAFSGRFFEKMQGSKEEGEPAKYVNSPETELFKKSKVLYGLDKAKGFIRKADCALLVEGQFDVVLSHQSGLPFAVAVSGTALTMEHLNLLARFSKRLVLSLDNDQAGLRAGLKSTAMAYGAGFDVKIPILTHGKDPADMARENPELLRAAIRTSQTAIEFFLGALRPEARDERGFKQIVEAQVLPLVSALQSKIDQEHFIQIIARKIGVSEDAVRQEVAQKPKLSDEPLESEAVKPLHAAQPTSAHALAMLQFYFDTDQPMQERVKEVVGEAAYEESLEKNLPDAERFRFEFESFGKDTAQTTEDLIFTLKRSRIKEDIESINRQLQRTEGNDPMLLKQLIVLKRMEQELRN